MKNVVERKFLFPSFLSCYNRAFGQEGEARLLAQLANNCGWGVGGFPSYLLSLAQLGQVRAIDGRGVEGGWGEIPPPRAKKSDPHRQKIYVLPIPPHPIFDFKHQKGKILTTLKINSPYIPPFPPRPKDPSPPKRGWKTGPPP